jgi:hypothetical protein
MAVSRAAAMPCSSAKRASVAIASSPGVENERDRALVAVVQDLLRIAGYRVIHCPSTPSCRAQWAQQ